MWESIEADPLFWQSLPEYPDTRTSIKYLNKLRSLHHDIYFVTSRPGVRAKLQTERWLRRVGFDDATVLISSEKAAIARALNFDAYIDDRWENVREVAMLRTVRTFLMVRPWNRNYLTVNGLGITEVTAVEGFVDSMLANITQTPAVPVSASL